MHLLFVNITNQQLFFFFFWNLNFAFSDEMSSFILDGLSMRHHRIRTVSIRWYMFDVLRKCLPIVCSMGDPFDLHFDRSYVTRSRKSVWLISSEWLSVLAWSMIAHFHKITIRKTHTSGETLWDVIYRFEIRNFLCWLIDWLIDRWCITPLLMTYTTGIFNLHICIDSLLLKLHRMVLNWFAQITEIKINRKT